MSSEYELMDVDEPPSRENSLIGRKLSRGEKSKIAAKSRRDKENIAFSDLVTELPLSSDVLNKMDKASVIRLAICYIKLKHFLQKDILTNQYKDIPKETRSILHSLKSSATPDELDSEAAAKELTDVEGQMMLDALNGFLIFINKKHSIRFISASVTDHLGLNVENLIGKNVNEIVHPCDIAELAKQFMPDSLEGSSNKRKAITDKCCPNSTEDKSQKVFYLRMKYNMCKNGSKTKQTGFTLVQWSGKLKQHVSSKNNSLVTDGLVCICRPMQTSSVMEIRMDGNMFMSRHDLGMTFTFCDTRIVTLIGYEPSELLGKTAYHFHNPIDAPKVSDCHQNLIIKGTSISKYYRFLGKNDNWVWLQTRATIIYNTANKPQYIVCMNYVISEEEGERYLMLEEHKHANIQNDNAVVTLPDNHHPALLFHTKVTTTPGPTIVELEEKNLKKTACLNGELDSRRVTQNVRLVDNNTVLNERLDTLEEYQEQSQSSSIPQAIQQQVCPLVSQGSLLMQQRGAQEDGRIQTIPASSFGSSCINIPTTQSTYPSDTSQSSNMIRDVNCLDNSFNNIFPESCQSSYSHSDDGGYESASSPSSSHRSPQVVSPYSSDMGSERAYTDMMSDREVALRTDGNSAIIKNCDFGVGYPYDYEQMSGTAVLEDEKSSDMQDAENILDELLQSFNQPTSNLDENMAVVFSTIESLTQQSCQTFSSVVKSPNILSEGKQVLGCTQSVKDNHQKSDKSVLRHILTIPEDKIPKQPVSLVHPPSDCNTAPNQIPSSLRDNKRCTSMRNISNKPPFRIKKSGERLIDSMIQKSLVGKVNEREVHSQKNICQGQTGAQNEQLPDDISDFALQYMETMVDSESEASLSEYTDLSHDFLMDTSEDNSDLTKGFLTGLEPQCDTHIGQPKFRSANRNVQYQYTNGRNETRKENNTKVMQQRYNLSTYGNAPRSSLDHGYVQASNRSQVPSDSMKMCNSVYGCRPVSYNNNQTQTSNKPISELEKHLRAVDQANNVAATDNKNPCGESSLLQKLLTGELSKDKYMQMEKDRCPRRHGLKPN